MDNTVGYGNTNGEPPKMVKIRPKPDPDVDSLEEIILGDPHEEIQKMMGGTPKGNDVVEVIVQGDYLTHRRGPKKYRRRKPRPMIKGFDSDLPDEDADA